MRALTISTSTPRRTDVTEDAGEAEVDEEEDVPVLINPELPNLKAVLDAADAVVEVLDARDPAAARSTHLEELAREGGKKLLLVLTKVGAYLTISPYTPIPHLSSFVSVIRARGSPPICWFLTLPEHSGL